MDTYFDIRIDSIRDLEFVMYPPPVVEKSQLDVSVELDGSKLSANRISQTITVVTAIDFQYKSETGELKQVLRYVNQTAFYVENFNEVFGENTDQFQFDKGLVRLLIDIIISTIRGILVAKTAGTSLADCYVPLASGRHLIR